MKRSIVSAKRLREANPSKKAYLVKLLTWCRGKYRWEMFIFRARTSREACLLAFAAISYDTNDLSKIVEVRDYETGKYIMDLSNNELLNRLRQIEEEQSVYYMKNLTTGQVLIDDTADWRDFCGEHFEANTDQSIVLWDDNDED